VNSMPLRIAALLAAALASVGAAAAPAGILIRDATNNLEFRLPAAYWEYTDRQHLGAQAQGGCPSGRVPPNLLFALSHKDALAQAWCEEGGRRFLMRNQGDLDDFVAAFQEAITAQMPGPVESLESSLEERDGMIVHRLSFATEVGGGGGGCAGPTGPTQKVRLLVVDYFVRPRGEDALYFRLACRATAEAFEGLAGEFDHVADTLRYTGEMEEQFFAPDAPPEKVAAALEAAAGSKRKGGPSWLLFGAILVLVWIMLRRRKRPVPTP